MNTIGNIFYDFADTMEKKETIKLYLNSIIIPNKNLLLAGNICNIYYQEELKDILTYLRTLVNTSNHIFYVPGYHEYKNCKQYLDTTHTVDIKLQKICKQCGVEFLQLDAIEGTDFVIISCTLWSLITKDAYDSLEQSLNIFKNRQEYLDLHYEHSYWLQKTINKNKNTNKKLIVMTHHSPSIKNITFKLNAIAMAHHSASTLDYLVEQVDMWVYGNSNEPVNVLILGTPLISNPVNCYK